MEQETKEFLDLEEVAEYLGVSARTIYRYIKDPLNPLPTFRINLRTIRVNKDELDAWLQNYKRQEGML